ncbi:MAG: HAMP domain-containing histidine kinase [Prevotellaceae bacterium]|jgi:signal transduction histidine kinase|nr:HAMP domain-containing histidine kinase [Prevotellaceae bacterium]
MIIAVIISVVSLLLFAYENRKRQKDKRDGNMLYDMHNMLTKDFEKLNIKENILSQIINCANKSLDDEDSFQISMKELVNTLRTTFQSEYCAIGKIVNDIVEDYAFDYEEHADREQQHKQKNSSNEVKKVNINNTEYMVCEALKNKNQRISIYNEEDIKKKRNNHYEFYKLILKSGKLSNTTIIPLRNNKLENFGYIQFINSENNSIDNIEQFQDGLLQLVQMVIKKEEDKQKLEENRKIIDRQEKIIRDSTKDSFFSMKIIAYKDDVDELLEQIMRYLSEEFKAAVISFRIPVLNGKEREPLFYLRKCFVNPAIKNSKQIEAHYYKNRVIKNKNELGGYKTLRCNNRGKIILENSMDSDYYSDFDLDLKEQTLIMPVLKDIGKYECIRIDRNPVCEFPDNQGCIDRFKKLYGLFKLRLFRNDKIQDAEIAWQEENYFIERLTFLSKEITLIFNSIIDKYENESLKIFRENLKELQFLKIRDFDKQFVEIIKESTHAKECSIYRYRKNDDYSEQIYLSETTSEKILYKGIEYAFNEIKQKLNYLLSDDNSIIVRVFRERKSKYLYNLHKGVHIGDFIEQINDAGAAIKDESVFLIPIIKKDEEATCLGVVVLLGKQKDEHAISTSYWEQDKGLIEFIVEMFTRISEADKERLTFLSQLRHELLVPIEEVVQENDFLFNKYEIRRADFSRKEVLGQLKNNLDNSFLFKHIITDIDLIYSSSITDIVYEIELQQDPQNILKEVVAFFRTEIPIKMSISAMPPLYMHKDRIKQVFINILKNAIKYSYKELYKRKPIEIYYKSPEESDTQQHEIRFVNYGIGILEEDKDRIFELYKRGKNAADYSGSPSGSGMGLYIVKEIMKAHGGDCIIRKLKDPTEISLIFPTGVNQK